ncbi:hypothetical protein M0802_011127 [Mischocyttarus mexicanus]|nr:hypothetical protein M0802_011127 [Mischocyttarus mexicanus]
MSMGMGMGMGIGGGYLHHHPKGPKRCRVFESMHSIPAVVLMSGKLSRKQVPSNHNDSNFKAFRLNVLPRYKSHTQKLQGKRRKNTRIRVKSSQTTFDNSYTIRRDTMAEFFQTLKDKEEEAEEEEEEEGKKESLVQELELERKSRQHQVAERDQVKSPLQGAFSKCTRHSDNF